MANNFTITISAVDKATASIRKINQSFERVTKPLERMKTSMGALGREAGLDRVGKSMQGVARAAGDVGGKIRGIVAPLAAITGFASVAGIARLTTEWGAFGMQLTNTAANIGISVESLQALRGAARYAGVSAESLDAGLQGLGTTLQDALYGRNNEARAVLNVLHIQLRRTANGTVDTTRAFMDLANVISRVKDPNKQRTIAAEFGITELLPLLRKGQSGIEEFERRVRASGGVMGGSAVAAAVKFQESMVDLQSSLNGVKYTIGNALIPVVKPYIDSLGKWVAANKDLIAQNVKGIVQGIAGALKQIDWKGIGDDIKKCVDAIGGWKNAAIGMVILMNGSLIASTINLGLAIGKLGFSVARFTTVTLAASISKLTGWGKAAEDSAKSAAVMNKSMDSIGKGAVGVTGKISGLIGRLGALYAAWEAGQFIGNLAYEHLIKGTKLDDNIGEGIARILAMFGNKDAQAALDINERAKHKGPVVNDPGGKAPIGIRFNNPGLLRSWGNTPVAKTKSGYFAVFPSASAGLSAMIQNLQGYGKKGYHTLGSIISHYAPSSDGNNTGAYIEDVAKKTGFDPNARLNMDDPKVMAPLVSAIIRHENAGQNPYDQAQINQAVAQQLHVQVEVKAAHGTHAKVTTKGNVTHSSKVAYAMQGPA